jgi:hypothetical protein
MNWAGRTVCELLFLLVSLVVTEEGTLGAFMLSKSQENRGVTW